MRSSDFGTVLRADLNSVTNLEALAHFGTNPGNLMGRLFLPSTLRASAPLVVVLHGCTQTAVDYATGSGWLELAERNGFAVLLPEQQRANNMNLCFNWFEPGDMQRDGGEPVSIKQMIDHTISNNDIDSTRVFITGLSAGAAMAGVMLATYPEVFAGGGLIAGLPYGVAASVPAALQRMRRAGGESASALGDMVQGANAHDQQWPRISVWHGDADRTVHPSNADATVSQWLSIHGLTDVDPVLDDVAGFPRRVWRDSDGAALVESFEITGMGHGTPLDTKGADGSGKAGPFMLDIGISSTVHLAAFWELLDEVTASAVAQPAKPTVAPRAIERRPSAARRVPPTTREESGVEKMINDALRAAGLMR